MDKYYEDQTRHIIDVVVDYLNEAPYRKFIWAEISFLSMWWDRADVQHRKALKRVVQSGQFEIVTGGRTLGWLGCRLSMIGMEYRLGDDR